MTYRYSITSVNEEERWIFVSSDDKEWDTVEPDSFVFLLKAIKARVGGNIVEVEDRCYKIPEDGLGLYYQWDTCFGITVIYPKSVESEAVIDFLLSFNDVSDLLMCCQ